MATYKVIQDIEADDKLFGPLSLKQFIFAGTALGISFLAFVVASNTVIYAAIPFIPFILVPAILAAPLGRDQPTEIWLAAQKAANAPAPVAAPAAVTIDANAVPAEDAAADEAAAPAVSTQP